MKLYLSQYRDQATGWMAGVQFLAGSMMGFFLFATASKQVLGPTQPFNQWVTGALTPGLK